MKKKVILVLIILIPSLIYFFFEYSEVNFKKMAYYGPKTLDAKGDTVYYTVPESALEFERVWIVDPKDSIRLKEYSGFSVGRDTDFVSSARIVIFVDKNEEEKLGGLLEYEKYKKEKLDMMKVVIMRYPSSFPLEENKNYYENYLRDSLGIRMSNFYLRTINGTREDYNKIRALYFNQKPIHVFNYFAVLVDKDRHIRGYYDPTYISEVKRMIEEYKHLVLKDEHANMQDINKIEKK